MAINTSKVVVAGLAAGVVANIVGFVGFGILLAGRMEAEYVAVAPALQGRGGGSGAMAATIISQFVVGILLVWLYAAMRPRFGPGMTTATYAALVVWLCGFLFHLDLLLLGLMSTATYMMAAIVAFVQLLASAAVGGMLYKEEDAATR
jgi:hypothetical protein